MEAIRKGLIDGPITFVDINSAYPRAMLDEHAFSEGWVQIDEGEFSVVDQDFYTVAGVSNGALPFRGDDGSLQFPHDDTSRTYYITGWELRAAQDTGANLRIVDQIHFVDTINFKKYIDHFYALKKAAPKKSPEYLFAKLFQNSLYGKFGANPETYKTYVTLDERYIDAAVESGDGDDGGRMGPWALLTNQLPENERVYYHVACAASITGWVRAYLWRSLHNVRKRGFEPIYCDTDSIAYVDPKLRKKPKSPVVISDELGDWGIDGVYERGGIAGKKVYAFCDGDDNWKTGCKGARLSAAEIMRVCKGEAVRWMPDAPTYSVGRAPQFLHRDVRVT